MNRTQFYLAFIASLFFTQPIKAFKIKNLLDGFKEQQTTGIIFTENKGQVRDQNSNPRPDVLFSGVANGMSYHLRHNGISYQLNRVDSWKEEEEEEEEDLKTKEKCKIVDQTTIYRLDINWLGINKNFTTQTEKPLDGCSNYYLEVCPNGISNVKSYEGVFYNNIYKNINLHYYQKNGALKYDYIIAPGADYKQIQLEIKGTENITLQKDGSLLFKTPLGTINEGAPIVYQNGKQLTAKWCVTKNILSFNITNYNPSLELIIDPATRLWGTYYGGAGWDVGESCTTDAWGNVYLAGRSNSNTGTGIATTGSHQSAVGGDYDAFLVKFNSGGIRQWCTYYGGAGIDYGHSCANDASGNVYLAGITNATTGTVIATVGSHQSAFGGGAWDAFLVKFDSVGIRQWGIYYGGAGGESGSSCTTDAGGNVYLAGQTNSNTGTVIATSGSHQSAYGGGPWDAFLVKFNSAGVRQWGTYYGGAGYDYGQTCTTDGGSNVYLVGLSDSSPGTGVGTAGSHQSTHGGAGDAFLVKFNSVGIRQWDTFYGGAGQEIGHTCTTDAGGNVYLAGRTDSNSGTVIATAGSHQSAYGGGIFLDAFLVKFNSAGVRQWGTYYGGTEVETVLCCRTDAGGNVYLAGSTGSNTGTVIATAGSHQPAYGGMYDAFLVKFNSVGIRQWGTYYGGAGTDNGYSCAIDALGNVFLAGITESNAGTVIATAGSHQSAYNGGTQDAFLVKFCAALNVTASVNSIVCAGSNINFTAGITVTATPTYFWAGPNGFTSSIQNPIIVGSGTINIGVYTLTVNNNGCIETTTLQVNTVNPLPSVSVNSGSICNGNSFTMAPGGASTYTYSSGSAVVTPTVTSNYNITGTDTLGCVSSNTAVITVTVNVAPEVMATTTNSIICTGEMAILTASTSATSYTWNTGETTLSISVSPTLTTTYTVIATATNGCIKTSNVTVTVNLCTGLNEADSKAISVYPNPNTGILNIKLTASLVQNSTLEIYDVLGKIVVRHILVTEATTLNISQLNNGMYTFKILNNSNVVKTGKLIKQ